MRPGMFPSQQRAMRQAFKKADKFDHFRARTRRSLVLGGVASVAAAVGAFWAGTRMGGAAAPPDADSHPRRQIVHRLAAATDPDLWQQRHTFLQALEEVGGDQAGWVGFRRLAEMALVVGPTEQVLAARMLKTLQRERPTHLQDVETRLSAIAR